MRIKQWLGFSEPDRDNKGHEIAMSSVNGDPGWMSAMNILKEFTYQEIHDAAVRDGKVVELFPSAEVKPNTEILPPAARQQISHVSLFVEVCPLSIYDQDQDLS